MPDIDVKNANPDATIEGFLTQSGWGAAKRFQLAGDASQRRYERLETLSGTSAILMDATRQPQKEIEAFLRIAQYLNSVGLSAPKILAEDKTFGLLLLEDLGDTLFARVVEDDPSREVQLYQAAVDVLLEFRDHPTLPDLPRLDAATMSPLIMPLFEWYYPAFEIELAPETVQNIIDVLGEGIDKHASTPHPVFIHRDYHAENLLWLSRRSGVTAVGILDFQDAHQGHPAYDLVSLLQDARRDVGFDAYQSSLARYLEKTGETEEQLQAAVSVLGVQRNLRILGIFGRLSQKAGKPHYVDLIPRVWRHITKNLSHPALGDLAGILNLPAPKPEILQRLKSSC